MIGVLYARDLGEGQRVLEVRKRHVAEADRDDQAIPDQNIGILQISALVIHRDNKTVLK